MVSWSRTVKLRDIVIVPDFLACSLHRPQRRTISFVRTNRPHGRGLTFHSSLLRYWHSKEVHTMQFNGIFESSPGWRVGSVVRALDLRCTGRGFESRQKRQKILWVFPSQKRLCDSLSVCPTPVCIHAYERPCTYVKYPVVHVVDYENTKIATIHLYPRSCTSGGGS